MLQPNQILVIYDGDCGFCSGVIHVLRRWDWRGAMSFLPFQTPALLSEIGVPLEEAQRTAMVYSPGGRLWKEGGAVAAIFDELLPLGLPLFRFLALLPGLRQLANAAYRLVSRNRGRLPSTTPDLKERPPPTLTVAEELRRRRFAERMPSALPPRTVD